MISKKMVELVKNGSAIRAMFEDGKIMAEKYGKENIYDFSLGNPSVIPPESVKNAIFDIIKEQPETEIHGYMNNRGYEEVREKIAFNINGKHGTNFNKNNIIMTVGAAGALNITLKTIINPGDEIILFAPYFGEYDNYISNYDGIPVIVKPNFENFSIDFEDFEKKISNKTKALIINNPNNPTGVVYSENDIKKLAEILESKQKEFNTSIYLISDEPYRELVFNDEVVPYITKYYRNTFVGYSYSKTLSLPGERIGYLVIPSEMDYYEEIFGALGVANRILGYVNAPSLFQKVISKCLDDTSDLSVYEENKNILYKALCEYGYECVEPKGTFYMFPKCFIKDDKAFCDRAKKYRLIIVPGSTFSCPGYFRIAYCVDKNTVINSLESFKLFAESYKF
ncbi:MAG: pyridoxal phosphate-dependent aminotransferase [Clostridiales bacterium]|nr:pyridoxal phosphate-dependent aminotransferase [Clostridiales bacterium]